VSDIKETQKALDEIEIARGKTRVEAENAIQRLINKLAALSEDSEAIPQVVSAAQTIIKLKEHMDMDSGS